jgi:very-short-patch-repair endonuclease
MHRAPLRAETEFVKGLRVTALPRAFLDLAAAGWPVGRLVHEAAASGRTSLATLRGFADEAEGRRGVVALRDALALPHLRSGGERRLRAAIRACGLPLPEFNAPIGRMTVDALYDHLGLAVELDHEETHGSAFAIARDARRDAELRRRGLEVRRVREADVPALLAELTARLRA